MQKAEADAGCDGAFEMIARLVCGVLVGVSVAASSAPAQTRDRHTSQRDSKTELPAKKIKPSASNSCPEFGPGFVRVEGSSSCVRVGGSIDVGVGAGR
jgi:hypothetical protein